MLMRWFCKSNEFITSTTYTTHDDFDVHFFKRDDHLLTRVTERRPHHTTRLVIMNLFHVCAPEANK